MSDKPATAVQFTPYEISMCLYDVQRTRLWKQAVEDVVREGDVVLTLGAGSVWTAGEELLRRRSA